MEPLPKKYYSCIQKNLQFRLNFPESTEKDDFQAKRPFLIDEQYIGIHIVNKKQERQYLVYCHKTKVILWYPLRHLCTVKQLNKRQFIVLCHNDCSVDKIEFINDKSTIVKVRSSQAIIFKQFEVELFVFNQNQSFCVVEKYKEIIMKFCYYKKRQGNFQMIEEMTTKYFSQIRQINEKSQIGWLQYRRIMLGKDRNDTRQCLCLINFDTKNAKYIYLPIQNPFNSRLQKEKYDFFQIIQIRQIRDEIYLCLSYDQKFWIFNTNKLYEPGCMQRVQNYGEDLKILLNYESYNKRIWEPFFIDRLLFLPEDSNAIFLNKQKSVVLIALNTCPDVDHNPNVNFHTYYWDCEVDEKGISCQFYTQIDMKDVFMQLLLHINEDFDDDLLQDAVQMAVK